MEAINLICLPLQNWSFAFALVVRRDNIFRSHVFANAIRRMVERAYSVLLSICPSPSVSCVSNLRLSFSGEGIRILCMRS